MKRLLRDFPFVWCEHGSVADVSKLSLSVAILWPLLPRFAPSPLASANIKEHGVERSGCCAAGCGLHWAR
jgi:hypothetical protein